MRAACSTRPDLRSAIDEIGEQLQADQPCHAAVVFVTHDYAEHWDDLAATVGQRLGTPHVLGCSAEGVICGGREFEDGPAISVLALQWPDDRRPQLLPVRLEFVRTPEGIAVLGWPDELLSGWPEQATLLLLAEPFSFPADYLLQQLNDAQPDLQVVGGMASGAATPGSNRLFFGDTSYEAGAVGWLLDSGTPLETVVSQGCRPVGEPLVVTAAEQNQVLSLGGKPALQQLQHLFSQLPTHEQALLQRGLHLGRVVNEYQDQFEMGDFLIRNVMGVDQDTQAIVVGDFIRPGQTVQFHLRDEATASHELQDRLARSTAVAPLAGLLFSCNGRGTRLFSDPHHDAQRVQQRFPDLPLAGFFAQGEIGPVGGHNFLHGFTASLLLL